MIIDGNYPTRLIVPATNFTAAFPKVGYKGIKSIFDENNINYNKFTIIQASDLKMKLEKFNIKKMKLQLYLLMQWICIRQLNMI